MPRFRSFLSAALLIELATAPILLAQGFELVVQRRHSSAVNTAISPDGNDVLSAGIYDGTIKLTRSAGVAGWVRGGLQNIEAMAFAPSGDSFAYSWGLGFRIEIAPVDSPDQSRVITHPTRRSVLALAWSPDGSMLAAADLDSVTIWSATTGELIRVLDGPGGARTSIRFSEDGSSVFAGGRPGVEIWQVATGTRRTIPTSSVQSIDVSRNGNRLLVATGKGLSLYDASTLAVLWSVSSARSLAAAAFVAGDSLLVVSPEPFETGLQVARVSDGVTVRALQIMGPNARHSSYQSIASASSAPVIAIGTMDYGAYVWHVLAADTAVTLIPAAGFQAARVFGERSAVDLIIENRDSIYMRDTYGTPARGVGGVLGGRPFAFDRTDGLLALRRRSSIALVDHDDGATVRELVTPDGSEFGFDLAWSRDGNLIAAAGDSTGTIHVFSRGGEYLRMLNPTSRPVVRVAFSRSGLLVARDRDGLISVMRPQTGELVRTIDARHLAELTAVAAETVLVGTGDGGMTLYSLETGDSTGNVEGSYDITVAASGNGTYLYTASADGTIRVWEVGGSAQPVWLWERYPVRMRDIDCDGVTMLAVADDGSLLRGSAYEQIVAVPSAPAPAVAYVSPQPASDHIRIELNRPPGDARVTVVDLLSRACTLPTMIDSDGSLDLDVSGLPSGVYAVIVGDRRSGAIARFVVRR